MSPTCAAEINESINKCLNKLAFDLENDVDLKKSNSDFDACIFISENLNISTISDVDSNENSNILAINSNINRLNLIIESLGSIENYEGLDRFLDILKDYLNNQESFLNSF